MTLKQRLSRFTLVSVVSIFAAVMLANTVHAAGSTRLTLTPSSATVTKDSTLTVTIKVETSDQINLVQSNLSYDQSQLEFSSIDASGSAFDFPFPSSGGSGKVTVVRGVSAGGSVTGTQTVAKVSFKVIGGSVSTTISFAPDSLVMNPSTGQDVWDGDTTGGSFTLTTPTAPQAPSNPSTPSSTSSPTQSSTPTSSPSTTDQSTATSTSSPSNTSNTTQTFQKVSAPSIEQQQADPSLPIPVSTKSTDSGNLVAIKVVDSNQNPIIDAEVVLGEKTAITDSLGVASFVGVAPGTYDVTIKSSKGEVKGSVTVEDGISQEQVQEQTFTVKPSNTVLYIVVIGGIALIAAAIYFIRKKLRGGSSHGSLYMNGKKVNTYQSGPTVGPNQNPNTPTSVPPAAVSLEKIKVNLPQPSTVITPDTPTQPTDQK